MLLPRLSAGTFVPFRLGESVKDAPVPSRYLTSFPRCNNQGSNFLNNFGLITPPTWTMLLCTYLICKILRNTPIKLIHPTLWFAKWWKIFGTIQFFLCFFHYVTFFYDYQKWIFNTVYSHWLNLYLFRLDTAGWIYLYLFNGSIVLKWSSWLHFQLILIIY